MSPRKARYEVSKHIVQSIRDKRNKILSGPYNWPKCNHEKLRIIINEEEKKVLAICKCGLKDSLVYTSKKEAIDYYNDLIDKYYT